MNRNHNEMKKLNLLLLIVLGMISCQLPTADKKIANVELIPYPNPNSYLCYRSEKPIIVDGLLSADEWGTVKWTEYFKDIEGAGHATPRYKTRAKMMWDDSCLYIAAELEEPDVWARIRERDAVIYYDNDFEVFVDPDGDTHNYYELEVNAFATAWDLLLSKPYRDGGCAIDSWNIVGLDVAVSVNGTINNTGDTDKGWTVEMAIPFKVIAECKNGGNAPQSGEYWRINFSRVEWKVYVENGQYFKVKDSVSGKILPEDNWVWSPQDHINMHMPEYWGFLLFTDKAISQNEEKFIIPIAEKTKWLLRNVYYQQVRYYKENSKYAESLRQLGVLKLFEQDSLALPEMEKTVFGYNAFLPGDDSQLWIINEEGRTSLK